MTLPCYLTGVSLEHIKNCTALEVQGDLGYTIKKVTLKENSKYNLKTQMCDPFLENEMKERKN